MRKGLTPQGYYISPIAGKVHYQSGYEHRFMEYLDSHKFNWQRCKDRFPYIDENGDKHMYNPDIYLPDYDLYIEVKGMIRFRDPFKFEAFPIDKKLLLVDAPKLKELGIKVFDPNEITKDIDKTKWPYKILNQIPDYAKQGELSKELKERLYKYNYIFKKEIN